MAKMNWHRVEQERKVNFRPAPAPSQAQVDFILGLAHQKDRKVTIPATRRRAGELIDQLQALPDVNERVWYRNGKLIGEPILDPAPAEPRVNLHQEIVIELRERFPQLSPMTANSMVQLFSQLDALGAALTFEAVMAEEAPADTEELILHIMRRFMGAFSDVNEDDSALAA